MDADGTRRTGGIRSDEDHFTLHAAGTPTARGRFVRAAGLEPVSDTPSAAQAGGVVVPVGAAFPPALDDAVAYVQSAVVIARVR